MNRCFTEANERSFTRPRVDSRVDEASRLVEEVLRARALHPSSYGSDADDLEGSLAARFAGWHAATPRDGRRQRRTRLSHPTEDR